MAIMHSIDHSFSELSGSKCTNFMQDKLFVLISDKMLHYETTVTKKATVDFLTTVKLSNGLVKYHENCSSSALVQTPNN